MIPPVHVILNPESGAGKGRAVRPEIERELAARFPSYTLTETERPGHAVELAREAARSGAGIVIAAGGDGTVHEVVNGLLEARDRFGIEPPALGVVPVGTGNDLIKAITGGTDRARAFAALGGGRIRHFDVGRVEWEGGAEYFINGAGTGIDVEVVRQIQRLPRLPGVVSYFLGLVRALRRFRPIPIRVRLDDETIEETVMIIVVGNGFCLAGGFYVCPGAVADDGLFDVCIVKEVKGLQIPLVLSRVLRGTHVKHPRVYMRRARSIEITAMGSEPLFFQLDGELREPGAARALRITLEPGAIPTLAADGTPGHHLSPGSASALAGSSLTGGLA